MTTDGLIHCYIGKRGWRSEGGPELKLLCTGQYISERFVHAYSVPTKVTCYPCIVKLLEKYEAIVDDLKSRAIGANPGVTT